MPDRFKTFDELARHLREQGSAERRDDVRRAENLRRSRPLANVRPGAGPRVAR